MFEGWGQVGGGRLGEDSVHWGSGGRGWRYGVYIGVGAGVFVFVVCDGIGAAAAAAGGSGGAVVGNTDGWRGEAHSTNHSDIHC